MFLSCFRRRTRCTKEEDSVSTGSNREDEEEDSSPDALAQTLSDLVKSHDQKVEDDFKCDVERRLRTAFSSPKILKTVAKKGLRAHTVQVVKTPEEVRWCREVVNEFPSADVPPGLRVCLDECSKLRDGGWGREVWHECTIRW